MTVAARECSLCLTAGASCTSPDYTYSVIRLFNATIFNRGPGLTKVQFKVGDIVNAHALFPADLAALLAGTYYENGGRGPAGTAFLVQV